MKRSVVFILAVVLFSSCNTNTVVNAARRLSWETREASASDYENLTSGNSYLPIYSHIYYAQENSAFYLTATISIRNISPDKTAYLLNANYFNTDGKLVKEYLKRPIFIKPLETIEFVIAESDKSGGSGANFIFDWAVEDGRNAPLFEAVMISTQGQQGLSFTTRGVRIY